METSFKILIVEDDPIIAEDLEAYMIEFGYNPLTPVTNASDALKSVKKNQPDLCLLDVHLGSEINGIQLAKMIKEIWDTRIIFLTAFNDKDTAERIMETEPSAYLVKPVDERNLQASIELAFSNYYSAISRQNEVESNKRLRESESVFIKVKDRLAKFKFDDILYFEAYDNYAFLYTSDKKYILSSSLKQIEDRLPNSCFIRTHRSYIVNLKKIQDIGYQQLTIEKNKIPIGKTYRALLMDKIDLL